MNEVVSVTGIASGGDGVGRLADGRAVFVPRTVPGERVLLRAESLKLQRRYARGEVAEIIEPAAHRVEPRCPHYVGDRCGGCQLQHLDYESQLAAKRGIVGEALRRIGKLDLPDPEIVAAPEPWRYRTEITLAVAGGAIGFHPFDRPGSVFALRDCHIADPRLIQLLDGVRAGRHLLPERITRLTLRLDREGRRHVVAESAGEPWRGDSAAELNRQMAGDASVICWWQPVEGAARIIAGPATGPTATAFEQVNPGMSRAAREWAVEQLGTVAGVVAWDLYGGVGDIAVLLASRGAQVVSVDADEQAIAWARNRPEVVVNGNGTGEGGRGTGVRFIAARVEDVVAGLPEPAVVVVNPPRGGLHWDVSLRLTSEPVSRVVYLSRDPATLARDLYRLSVNYHVRAVRAFDSFPQTAHVETVVAMERAE